jgi:pimeloyl-ACP methyl ester carboxylesterase
MQFFPYKNTSISFSETGKGATVVLLHGFLENKSMWDFFIPALSKKYRVLAIDLFGHGATENLGYIHSMEDQADMVFAVLQSLKVRKASFIGHSMGGYVALAFAELYPDYCKGIALVNSTSAADSDERKLNRDRAIKCVKQNYASFISMSIGNLFSEKNREIMTESIEMVKNEALKTPLQGIVASLEGMKIRKDREVLLHFSTFPILLVLGKQDPVLNYSDALKQIENTSVELVVFNDGHMSHLENTQELLEVLVRFLKKT